MGIGRPRTCNCGICDKCKHREYMREWYYRSGKRTYPNKEKANARARARWADDPEYRKRKMARTVSAQQIRRGKVVPRPCALCGGEKVVTHHNDYDHPYERTFLCEGCHAMIHMPLPDSG